MSTWFSYKIPPTNSIAREGGFDLLDVVWCEGSSRSGGPWTYTIYLRTFTNNVVVLDAPSFLKFSVAWAAFQARHNEA
jgi:hypothetical protein